MNMRKFAFSLLSLVFLFSCSDYSLSDSNLTVNEIEFAPKMQEFYNRIDMEEAMAQAQAAIGFLDREHPSESGSRMVSSVSVLRFGAVKAAVLESGEYRDIGFSDTLAYVFNFNDSLGFAIVSIDKRVDSPLFAFTKWGHLVNGKTDNPGLMIFLERLEGYVLESIIEAERHGEAMPDGILGKLLVEPGKIEEQKQAAQTRADTIILPIPIKYVFPLVPVEWGQGGPFNLRLDSSDPICNKYKTGCVATATVQIMSYWQYPTNINGNSYAWATLNEFKNKNDFTIYSTDNIATIAKKTSARVQVSSLFEQVSSINLYYGCDASGAQSADGLHFLLTKGFKLPWNTYFKPYDIEIVNSFLAPTYRRPLMANGRTIINNNSVGHAWVIDGLMAFNTFKIIDDTVISNKISYHIHNNWGWDGLDNGYYLSGVFNPLHPSQNIQLNFQNVEIGSVYR